MPEHSAVSAPYNACAATSGAMRATSDTWSGASGTAAGRAGIAADPYARPGDPAGPLGTGTGRGLDGPGGCADLHTPRCRTARILHTRHRAVTDELGIQLVRKTIAAEFPVEVPEHFALRLERILGQSERRLEGA